MRRGKLLIVLLLSIWASTAWSIESGRPPIDKSNSGILLVDCAGAYLRIAIENRSPKLAGEGRIWDAPGAQDLRPSHTEKFDGCLVADAAGDPGGKYLYVAVAREPFYGEDDSRGYRMASLRLPALDVISHIDLPEVALGGVNMLLSPDGSQMLMWHSTISGATEALRSPLSEGKFAGPSRRSSYVLEQSVSRGAHWSTKDRIIDGSSVLDERGMEIRWINPYKTFGSWARTAFPDLVREGAKGAPFLQISHADSSSDRMLFVVNPDRRSEPGPLGGGLVVFDLHSGKTTAIHTPTRPAALDPFRADTPTAHLTPDGLRVVLEEHEFQRERDFRRKTGTIRLYDAGSGSLQSTVFLANQPGFSGDERVTGFAERDQLMFYANREKIFVIDLVHGVLRATLEPEIPFDPNPAIGIVSYGPTE